MTTKSRYRAARSAEEKASLKDMIDNMMLRDDASLPQTWWEEEMDVLAIQEWTMMGNMEEMMDEMETSMDDNPCHEEGMDVEVSREEEPPSHGAGTSYLTRKGVGGGACTWRTCHRRR